MFRYYYFVISLSLLKFIVEMNFRISKGVLFGNLLIKALYNYSGVTPSFPSASASSTTISGLSLLSRNITQKSFTFLVSSSPCCYFSVFIFTVSIIDFMNLWLAEPECDGSNVFNIVISSLLFNPSYFRAEASLSIGIGSLKVVRNESKEPCFFIMRL